VLVVNLKRLIGEVLDGRLSSRDMEMRERNASIISNATDASGVSAESVSRQMHLRHVSALESKQTSDGNGKITSSPTKKQGGTSSIDSLVACGILSALITWLDLSESMKEVFRDTVGLNSCGRHITVGMIG
jgi:hypothetical protein